MGLRIAREIESLMSVNLIDPRKFRKIESLIGLLAYDDCVRLDMMIN